MFARRHRSLRRDDEVDPELAPLPRDGHGELRREGPHSVLRVVGRDVVRLVDDDGAERVIATTLAALPADLAAAGLTGPALTFLGLSPRAALSRSAAARAR